MMPDREAILSAEDQHSIALYVDAAFGDGTYEALIAARVAVLTEELSARGHAGRERKLRDRAWAAEARVAVLEAGLRRIVNDFDAAVGRGDLLDAVENAAAVLGGVPAAAPEEDESK